MKTWSCPKKKQARFETIIANGPIANQYWSMAGLSTDKGCEVDQILEAGIIKPEQFHGVEIVKDIYDANLKAWPNLAWHHGDFLEVMQNYPDFHPGLVNADLMLMADTAADYIARIIYLLVPFDAVLLANFVMEHRGHKSTPDQVLERLCQCQQFRYAMRNGWAYDGKCYLYDGTGHRSYTVMGTFTFRRVKPLLVEPLTKDRRKKDLGTGDSRLIVQCRFNMNFPLKAQLSKPYAEFL